VAQGLWSYDFGQGTGFSRAVKLKQILIGAVGAIAGILEVIGSCAFRRQI
jgi:hypothetical protein